MMNLSINLTLGSPGAESVLNTASAPEDNAVDSFSLKLADELSEQELTPPIVVEDTRAADPVLLEAIAARQKLATDAEVVTAKDGRVWLEDPLAGLPVAADKEAELTETITEDKPWFDIIEKAKSYGPALQANKTSDSSSTAPVLLNEDHALVGTEDPPQLPLADLLLVPEQTETTSAEAATAAAVLEAAVVETEQIALSKAGSPAVSASQTLVMANEQEVLASEQELLAPKQKMMAAAEAKETNIAGSEITPQGTVAQSIKAPSNNIPLNQTAVEQVVTDTQTTGIDSATTNSAPQTASAITLSASTTASSAAALPAKTVTAEDKSAIEIKTAQALNATTNPMAEQSIMVSEVELLTKTAGAGKTDPALAQDQPATATQVTPATKSSEPAALLENAVSAVPQPTEPVRQAELVAPAIAVPVNPSRVATSGSADKVPAANTFAEHLKTVNQSQQQQQQQHAGTEQQTGQGQAKAAVEMMVTNQPAQPAATAAPFSQQLQQLQQTQPLTEQTATAASLTQPITQTAGAGHTTLTASRPAETPGWQAPLALTEPAAAQQLKDRVMVQIQHKLQTAEVQLHPEDMGSMQIKLNLQQDQLSVQFVVQQGAAKEALEQQMPKLRELLEQQGIALTEGQVEQRQSGGQQEQRQARSGPSGGTETDLAAVQTVQMKVSDRMVDFYA